MIVTGIITEMLPVEHGSSKRGRDYTLQRAVMEVYEPDENGIYHKTEDVMPLATFDTGIISMWHKGAKSTLNVKFGGYIVKFNGREYLHENNAVTAYTENDFNTNN